MAQNGSGRTDDVREILINVVEVELAALRAAVSFWQHWIEHTSNYVKTTSEALGTMRSTGKTFDQVLLEVVDAGRETMRLMTDVPRKSAEDFLRDLEVVSQKKADANRSARAKL